MESIQFLVQGSSAEPYEVTFVRDGQHLAATCTCPAGSTGTACKHRLSIFAGKASGIVSPNSALVGTVAGWLPGSPIAEHLAAVDAAERELEQAKQRVSAAKKRLSAALGGK